MSKKIITIAILGTLLMATVALAQDSRNGADSEGAQEAGRAAVRQERDALRTDLRETRTQ